jgi:signal transduction histidine kinase
MVRDEQKKVGYLRTMRSEADRLHHLVENVLAYSRIERGSARTRRERVDAAEMLERMHGRLEERAKRDGLEMLLEWSAENPVMVRTDVTAVEQVVFNLVDNACKYGRRNGGGGTVRVRGGVAGHRVRIEVSDEGPGVPAGEARRMFRAFHKSATEAAHSQPGVGLGLALSRRLARALGGDLVLCNPGQPGAVFRFEFGGFGAGGVAEASNVD